MLKRQTLLILVAAWLCGCGGPHVDAKAKESVERLPAKERAAAQVLVELETATRDEDTSALCSRVYAYDASRAQCERSFGDLLDRQQSMALDVQDVRLRGHTAVAHAAVTTLGNDGDRRTDDFTFQLVRAGDEWKVKFQ
jgi:hypothetical protein